MIERRDSGDERQRLTQGENFPGFSGRRDIAGEDLPIIPQSFHGGEGKDIAGAPHLIACFPEAETGLRSDQLGELPAPRLQQIPGPVKDAAALISGQRLLWLEVSGNDRIQGCGRDARHPAYHGVVPWIGNVNP